MNQLLVQQIWERAKYRCECCRIPTLVGLTPVGRVTIHVLAMNADDLLLFRAEILREGITLV
jgi:hypothetical protein